MAHRFRWRSLPSTISAAVRLPSFESSNSALGAGSVHTLRVQYQIGMPASQLAGNYPPAVEWSAGPKLRWSLGFTDLGAGRYLEAWIPANLVFDQFELTLGLRINNTAVAHTVIQRQRHRLGANQWAVVFPAGSPRSRRCSNCARPIPWSTPAAP